MIFLKTKHLWILMKYNKCIDILFNLWYWCIYYQWNPTYLDNPNLDAKKLILEYNYYVFYDTEHDTLLFNIILNCIGPNWLIVVSTTMNI